MSFYCRICIGLIFSCCDDLHLSVEFLTLFMSYFLDAIASSISFLFIFPLIKLLLISLQASHRSSFLREIAIYWRMILLLELCFVALLAVLCFCGFAYMPCRAVMSSRPYSLAWVWTSTCRSVEGRLDWGDFGSGEHPVAQSSATQSIEVSICEDYGCLSSQRLHGPKI